MFSFQCDSAATRVLFSRTTLSLELSVYYGIITAPTVQINEDYELRALLQNSTDYTVSIE